MSTDNLCCFVYGPKLAKLATLPPPKIVDPYDVLIRISFVGVCGSDVHFWEDGGLMRSVSEEHPIVMGHEGSGIVQEVGHAVTTLKPGDKVAIEPGAPCRRCMQCKSGKYNLCTKMAFASDPPYHGLLARSVKVQEDFAYKLPDGMSLEEGALLEPLAVAVHAVRLTGITGGQDVLVLGSGTIGLLVAAVAQAYGSKRVCIADIKPSKLEFAKSFINCHTFKPQLEATPEANASRFKQESGFAHGADVVLECTGAESSAQTAVYAARAGATYTQVGMGKPVQSLPFLIMCDKELTMKACFRYSQGDYEMARDLAGSGRVALKPLISNILPFEKAEDAWAMTARGDGIKNMIRGVED